MVSDRVPAVFVEARRRKRCVEEDSVGLTAGHRFELIEQGSSVALPLTTRGHEDAGDVVAAESSCADKSLAVFKEEHLLLAMSAVIASRLCRLPKKLTTAAG